MDMLVKLYNLPPASAVDGVDIRRSITPEKHIVVDWVRRSFSQAWASECEVAYSQQPPTCFIAVQDDQLLGFGCYDTTCKGFFGPTGVDPAARGRGIGTALLLACLHAMRNAGYGYAIIGAVGPTEFYQRSVGAIPIEESWPGVYRGMLRNYVIIPDAE